MIALASASGLLGILVQLVIVGLIFYILWWALGVIAPPEPFRKILTVILVLVAVIYLVNLLLGVGGVSLG